jgi:hypothetical protein
MTTSFPKVMELLKEKGVTDMLVLGGGIIPDEDIPALKDVGIAEVFGPGTTTTWRCPGRRCEVCTHLEKFQGPPAVFGRQHLFKKPPQGFHHQFCERLYRLPPEGPSCHARNPVTDQPTRQPPCFAKGI